LVEDKELAKKIKTDSKLVDELGQFTIDDIVKSLTAPTQDPRTEFKTTEFRKDAQSIKDIKIGEWYPGIVKNITQFGAFVDIGIKENGLVHVSQMADHFVENALDALKAGQEVKVMVLDVDMDRKRISLTCKKGEDSKQFVRPSGGAAPRQGGNRTPRPQADAPIKNNAFAALKNFKLK